MLLTLKHLLVTVALLMLGFLMLPAVHELAVRLALPSAATVAIAIAVVLAPAILLGWPLYKCLHLRPLILPHCPHCRRRHANYHIPRAAWPDAVLICPTCGGALRLWLTRDAELPPSDPPAVRLRWPEFLGLWRKA